MLLIDHNNIHDTDNGNEPGLDDFLYSSMHVEQISCLHGKRSKLTAESCL